MPFDHEISVTPGGNRDNLHEEAAKLLKLAEELQDKCELYERRMLIVNFIAALVPFGFVCFGTLLILSPIAEAVLNYVFIFLSYFYAFGTGILLLLQRMRIRRMLTRDRRAVYGIVDMLRELEQGIAKKNNLSALERAEFRIRLSRFDIGPGYHPALEE